MTTDAPIILTLCAIEVLNESPVRVIDLRELNDEAKSYIQSRVLTQPPEVVWREYQWLLSDLGDEMRDKLIDAVHKEVQAHLAVVKTDRTNVERWETVSLLADSVCGDWRPTILGMLAWVSDSSGLGLLYSPEHDMLTVSTPRQIRIDSGDHYREFAVAFGPKFWV